MPRRFPVQLTLLLVALLATPLLAQSNEDKNLSPVAKVLSEFKGAVDPATGRLRTFTPAETQELRAAMQKMFMSSAKEGVVTTHDNGMVELKAEGAPNVAVARVNEDGNVEVFCADDVESAVSFMTRRDVPAPAQITRPEGPSRAEEE